MSAPEIQAELAQAIAEAERAHKIVALIQKALASALQAESELLDKVIALRAQIEVEQK